MGRKSFFLMYMVCGLLAFIPSSIIYRVGVPHVGASGAIAGVMAAYFVFFPKVKFNLRFFLIISFNVTCFIYFFLWFGYQLLLGFLVDSSSGGVAWEAHVGGFVVGLVWALFLKKSKLV